jgi:LDH2 family malate/lactate/ureidoglycolate dehydrogenase
MKEEASVMLYLTVDEATALCRDALLDAGVPADQTDTITDCILYASRRGVDTHGIVSILPATLAGLRAGRIRPQAAVEVVQEGPAVARIDAHQAPGPVAGAAGMDVAIERARRYGIGAAVVFNGNHFGAASYYTERARRAGMIGLAMCNAAPRVAPHQGRQPFLGTNPIAYAAPGGAWPEITFDAATSAAAAGKVGKALRRGEPIPAGWVIDAEGQPITDAARAAGSTFLHFGEHKGYGIAMLVELLTGALAGARCGLAMPRGGDEAAPQHRAYFFLALDVAQVVPPAVFAERVDQLARDAHSIAPAPGATEVLVPGEPELRAADERQARGIPFHDGDWRALLRGLAAHGYDADWVAARARPRPE